jgi:excisionase family DNA binding protein
MTNSTALNATKRTDRPIDGRRATVTVTEAADILGISRSTAYELARAGTLPALRLGRRLVVPTHALEALLDSVVPRPLGPDAGRQRPLSEHAG